MKPSLMRALTAARTRTSRPVGAAARAQRGSMAVTIGLFMLVALVLVESLTLGYQFYMRRQMQNVADLAALSGAQTLSGATCTAALAAANSNATLNGGAGSVVVDCGNWTAATNTYTPVSGIPATNPNAVRVQVVGNLLPFTFSWMPYSTVGASAVAIRNGTPVAVFSIGSNLLCSLYASVLCNNSAVNVNLSMISLLRALGYVVPTNITVGQLNTLLASNSVTVNNLLAAVGSVTGLSNLSASLGLTGAVGNTSIPLLNVAATTNGLFSLASTAASSTVAAASMLNAQVNALDLVLAGVGIANKNSAIGASVNALGMTAQAYLVAPPAIGIGGVGTTAYAGQVRLYAHITTAGLTGAVPLLGLVANVDLPIEIDVAGAQATLTSMCTVRDASNNDTATFTISNPLLQACVGNITQSGVQNGTNSCTPAPASKTVISLVGGLATVNAGFTLNFFDNGATTTLSAGQSYTTSGNSLALGTTLSQILTALNTQLVASLLPNSGSSSSATGSNSATGSTTLASALLNTVGATLSSTASASQTALSSLSTLSSALTSTGTSLLSGGQLNLLNLLTATTGLVTSLLSSVGQIVGGLVSGLLYPCGLLGNAQACLASKLSGTGTVGGTTVYNSLLTVMGVIANLLQPVLNALGSALANLLQGLLGANVGQATLKLISLNCLGTDVRLVQ